MTRVAFKTGNIVDETTEGLVCSGNVYLNMSGGVNGELLSRGGREMQRQLHACLSTQPVKYVEPGFAVRIGPEPFAFRSIVYTVAVDALYDSSVERVRQALSNAFEIIKADGCRSVSVPALATGYGHLSKEGFGRALRLCLADREWGFDEVRVVLATQEDLESVKRGYFE